jgi:hypothetical protein
MTQQFFMLCETARDTPGLAQSFWSYRPSATDGCSCHALDKLQVDTQFPPPAIVPPDYTHRQPP